MTPSLQLLVSKDVPAAVPRMVIFCTFSVPFSAHRTACDDNVKLSISAELCFARLSDGLTGQLKLVDCIFWLFLSSLKMQNKPCKTTPCNVLTGIFFCRCQPLLVYLHWVPISVGCGASCLARKQKLANSYWLSEFSGDLGTRPVPQGAVGAVVERTWWVWT